jgi:hypothetical protein
MSNQLVNVDQMPLADIMSIADAFFKSGMFPDIKAASQAVVKIQAGQEIGIPPFMAMSGLHIIKGKVTIGSGIMSAKIKASPKYNYKVIAKTDKVCKLEFFEDSVSQGVEEFTADDARRAETQNMHRHPKNMLFARCISNGQKTYAPDVFLGPVYTPEDFGIDGDAVTEDIAVHVTTANAGQQPSAPVEVDEREELTESHPKWALVVDALQNKGYKLPSVEKQYRLSDHVRGLLEFFVPTAPNSAAPGQGTTQQMIHANNANHVAPAVATTATSEAGGKKRPF